MLTALDQHNSDCAHSCAVSDSGVARGPGATIRIQQYLPNENAAAASVDSQADDDSFEHQDIDLAGILSTIESGRKPVLRTLAESHAVSFEKNDTLDQLRNNLSVHLTSGGCSDSTGELCSHIRSFVQDSNAIDNQISRRDLQIHVLSMLTAKVQLRPLRRLLSVLNVQYESNCHLAALRTVLKKYTSQLRASKRSEDRRAAELAAKYLAEADLDRMRNNVQQSWPHVVGEDLKERLVKLFREHTSQSALSTFTCAVCAEDTLNTEKCETAASDIDLDLLRTSIPISSSSSVTLPYIDGPLRDVLVDPLGVRFQENGELILSLCKVCRSSLIRHKLPALALANYMYLGQVPGELKELTVVEEAMIARCRAKCWIVQLKEQDQSVSTPDAQRGVRGHIIIYPQRPSEVAKMLPPSLSEILAPICVLFVGSSPPTQEWLREKAKPLAVRREKVRSALLWLKANNPLYSDIEINHALLDSLDSTHFLPFYVEHLLPSDAGDILTSRYDNSEPDNNIDPGPDSSAEPQQMSHRTIEEPESALDSLLGADVSNRELPFENVVITDTSGNAPANELRAAALRHVKRGGGYIQVPHDPTPVNEFFNPELFPMIYPTLFPYGIGGLEDRTRKITVSMKRHVRHLFNLSDRRFQEHYSFLFTVFNILQRRSILLHTSLKVKRSKFNSVAADIASVSPETIHIMTERISRGDSVTANNDDERKVLNLMKEVNTVTSHVPASAASRVAMRNEIRALMIDLGSPSFFITINPADVYNPLVKFLGRSNTNIDQSETSDEVFNYWEQAILVAKNPFVPAKFFNIYMKAVISALLKFDPTQTDLEGGVLGVVKGYYGCVEAQGRGSLHCHMMVWLEGALNPNEIKNRIIQDGDTGFRDRLIAFLDDTISNDIPIDANPDLLIPSSQHHPCSVEGVSLEIPSEERPQARQKDLYHLVKACQYHKHSNTCYKYWKGPGHPKECRFDLDENNICLETKFNMETGELCFRCLNGLVNNFNRTILEAIRCNMDIKFIGSGSAAKAVTYYITNYITKSQLKTHVAYAALELAVNKLGEYDPHDDEVTLRAKSLLRKCAFTMISHQELSGQQVASYLMDYEDHFTSHSYRNLYWTSFESFINTEEPSPECYIVNPIMPESEPTIPETFSDIDSVNEMTRTDQYQDNAIPDTDNSEIEVDPLNNYLLDPELTIHASPSGELVAKAAQVADYQLRGKKLDQFCVWDFISLVDKVPKSTRKMSEENDSSDNEVAGPSSTPELLSKKMKGAHRIKDNFLSNHIECHSHILSVRFENKRLIPVPIGPSLPRRDRKEIYARYCRLMLILFKPWRQAKNLRETNESWIAAFDHFQATCSIQVKKLMNNIQMLHECRDSGIDHLSDRQRHNNRTRHVSSELVRASGSSDDFGPADPAVILEHLQSISMCTSDRAAAASANVQSCLDATEKSGMFYTSNVIHAHNSANFDALSHSHNDHIQEVQEADLVLENTWKKEYEFRRNQWKLKSTNIVHAVAEGTNVQIPANINTGGDLRAALEGSKMSTISHATIAQDIPATELDMQVNIDDIIAEFTLNREQARAFRLVCSRTDNKDSQPLRMYLGGAGGTGKSRVISSIKVYLTRRGQSHRLRLASYTGVAARNVMGITVHAALCLNQRDHQRGKLAVILSQCGKE